MEDSRGCGESVINFNLTSKGDIAETEKPQ